MSCHLCGVDASSLIHHHFRCPCRAFCLLSFVFALLSFFCRFFSSSSSSSSSDESSPFFFSLFSFLVSFFSPPSPPFVPFPLSSPFPSCPFALEFPSAPSYQSSKASPPPFFPSSSILNRAFFPVFTINT